MNSTPIRKYMLPKKNNRTARRMPEHVHLSHFTRIRTHTARDPVHLWCSHTYRIICFLFFYCKILAKTNQKKKKNFCDTNLIQKCCNIIDVVVNDDPWWCITVVLGNFGQWICFCTWFSHVFLGILYEKEKYSKNQLDKKQNKLANT